MVEADRIPRLRWLCRRGMKELDVLLERFVNTRAQVLSGGEWPHFEALLEMEDDRLWDGIQDPQQADPVFRELLQAIRDARRA